MKPSQDEQYYITLAKRGSTSTERLHYTEASDSTKLPIWVHSLQQISKDASLLNKSSFPPADRCLQIDDPIPFEEILLPFVRFARTKLHESISLGKVDIKESVYRELERHLLWNASSLAGQCLEEEYSLFRLKRDRFQFFLYEKEKNGLYLDFVKQLTGDRFWQFFLEYSVLARLLILQVQHWLQFYSDLFMHLQTDIAAIEQTLWHGETPGMLIDILPGNSDPHRGGRSVCILTFETGKKLVYKPRNLAIDRTFFELQHWINTHGLPSTFKIPLLVSRTTHGWMEYIEHLPCETEQDVQEYYQRSGMLICLVYVLEGTDCHDENLITHGCYPMLIDVETLFHHHLSWTFYKEQAQAPFSQEQVYWQNSVLATGLLPIWVSAGQQVHNLGGLGGGEREISLPILQYNHINTDAMVLEQGWRQTRLKANRVLLHNQVVEPTSYRETIAAGFKHMYTFLREHQQEFYMEDGPMLAFLGCPSRFLARDTHFYAKLLERLQDPKYLRDYAAREQELEVLKQQPGSNSKDEAMLTKLAEAELLALQQLDIPWFHVKVGTINLESDEEEVQKNFFAQSTFELVRERLGNLDDANFQRQASFLHAALLTTALDKQGRDHWVSKVSEVSEVPIDQMPEDSQSLLRAACHMAELIQMHVVPGNSGSPTWLGLCDKENYVEFGYLRAGLCDGVSGIALFLATLEQITQGTGGYRDLIIAALHSLCVNLRQMKSPLSETHWDQMGVGGGSGLGSIVYALCKIGEILALPELLDCAYHAALLITEQRIQADVELDVIAGSAGAILGLLKLYETVQDRTILQRAVLCGRHLLEQRVQTYPSGRSWIHPIGHPQTGFSHGVAGIAYALLRLYEVTEDQEFYHAAEEALGYERSVFEVKARNWPYYRDAPQERRFGVSWCHGAPGIGLARLGSLAVLDTEVVRQEIEAALETTQARGIQRVDNLCCGNAGRIEVLLTASERLQRPELGQLARSQAYTLVRRAEQHQGMFHLRPNFPRETFSPELLQGASGIGFQLLRVAFPDVIPSLLLWR